MSGRRHHHGGGIHGRGAGRQTDLSFEKERPGLGDVHVLRVSVLSAGDWRHVRHRAEHNVDTVPRGQAQDIHTGVQDTGRSQIPDADAGQVPGVPVRGLRAQSGHQAQS